MSFKRAMLVESGTLARWIGTKLDWEEMLTSLQEYWLCWMVPRTRSPPQRSGWQGRGQHSVPDSVWNCSFKILYFVFSLWFCFLETFLKMQMFLGKSNQLPPTTRLLMKNLGRKHDFIQERGTCVHMCACLYPHLWVRVYTCVCPCVYVQCVLCVSVWTCLCVSGCV